MDLRSAEGSIRSIAERFASVEGIERKRYWYRISGILKLPDGVVPDDMDPAWMRFRYLSQAENLLNALSKEGWQLADGTVDVSFRTDVSGALMTLAGVVSPPSQRGSTTAHIGILIMREIGFD